MHDPVATYRLQLTPDFGFEQAEEVIPYLQRLGVSHLYLSPVFEATEGSTHGYDATDPGRLREAFGGEDGFRSLAAAADAAGMGILLDVVPNHVAASESNPWWWDVLELGRAATHARHFDVDWDPPERRVRGSIVLGVLADHYGRVLRRGELRLELDGDAPRLRWPGGLLPLAPHTVGSLVLAAADRCPSGDLAFVGRALARCHGTETTVAEDAAAATKLLSRVLHDSPGCRDALAEVLEEVNGDAMRLHTVLSEQHYELMRWQRSADELDYRRFFDVANLVGLRVEDPVVFDDVLGLPIRLHEEGLVDGFRLDHVDGLADPVGALERLRDRAPGAWILVEKILTGDEELPTSWPIEGTTGYEAMHRLTAVQSDPAGVEELERAWRAATGTTATVEEAEAECRRLVLDTSLHAEVARLANLFTRACQVALEYRDFTRRELEAALVAAVSATPAYRSYGRVVDGERRIDEQDVAFADRLLARAAELDPSVDEDLWAFLRSVLLFEVPGAGIELAIRLQQLCGPVAAKGDEDTLSYRWTSYAAAAEVGHPLHRPTIDVAAFHAWCEDRQRRWPRAITSLTTHDTKRGEDVRARLCVLGQQPEELLGFWRAASSRLGVGPDPALAWLLAQLAVAAHPLTPERLRAYAEKAAREAKQVTTWTQQDAGAEAAIAELATAFAADPDVLALVEGVHERLGEAFLHQVLVQKALGLTMPGVPDVYQGAELLELRLVDPDNRSPVNYPERQGLLEGGGDRKLALVRAVLHLRRRRAASFGAGEAGAHGALAAPDDVIAFTRGADVAVVARRFASRPPAGGQVALPTGPWRDVLSDLEVPGGPSDVADLVPTGRPVVVLERGAG